MLDTHPRGTVYVAWDNANTHEYDEMEAVMFFLRSVIARCPLSASRVQCYPLRIPRAAGAWRQSGPE